MVSWYRQRIAINEETGQKINVYTGISDWEMDLYPTLFYEHFNNLPNYNTFTLMFPIKVTLDWLLDRSEEKNDE